jgi:hypothetical protein
MKPFELLNCQPDQVGVDGHIKLSSHGQCRVGRRRLSIAVFPDQRRRPIEAMRLISFHVVNQGFVVQFADYQIIGSSLRQSHSVFHSVATLIDGIRVAPFYNQ